MSEPSNGNYYLKILVGNAIFNIIVAYYSGVSKLSGQAAIPLFAPEASPFDTSISGEVIVGSFILAFIVTSILTTITRRSVTKGKVDISQANSSGWVSKLPCSLFKVGFCLAFFAALVVAVPSVFLLFFLGISETTVATYLIVHTLYAAVLGTLIGYIAIRRALTAA